MSRLPAALTMPGARQPHCATPPPGRCRCLGDGPMLIVPQFPFMKDCLHCKHTPPFHLCPYCMDVTARYASSLPSRCLSWRWAAPTASIFFSLPRVPLVHVSSPCFNPRATAPICLQARLLIFRLCRCIQAPCCLRCPAVPLAPALLPQSFVLTLPPPISFFPPGMELMTCIHIQPATVLLDMPSAVSKLKTMLYHIHSALM